MLSTNAPLAGGRGIWISGSRPTMIVSLWCRLWLQRQTTDSPHHHERRDFIHHRVHPIGLERRPVSAFVPARIGTGSVEHGICEVGDYGPPGAPENDRGVTGRQQQRYQQGRVADRRPVTPLEQLPQLGRRDRGAVPIGLGQPLLDRQRGVHAGKTVVTNHGSRRFACESLSDTLAVRGPVFISNFRCGKALSPPSF